MPFAAENIRPDDLELLPRTVRDIARIVGIEAALSLVAMLGGLDFPVPRGEDNNRAGNRRFAMLAEAMGEPAAHALCREFGGERVFIPLCQKVQCRIRHRTIIREFDAGATVEELVLRHRMSCRAIELILKRPIAV